MLPSRRLTRFLEFRLAAEPHSGSIRAPALALAALAYAALIVYGNLVPLDYHHYPLAVAWSIFVQNLSLPLDVVSRGDYVLWYAPLGFLLTGCLATASRSRGILAGILVFALCVLLAVAVEVAQVFFPPRTVSLSDVIAESIGAAVGILVWIVAGRPLLALWTTLISGGPTSLQALFALYALAYLVLALFPFDFITSTAELSHKLADRDRVAFLVTESCGGSLRCGGHLTAEILAAAPIGVLCAMFWLRSRAAILAAFICGVALGLVIEALQALLTSGITQGASLLTRGIGMALGAAVYSRFRRDWLTRYRDVMKGGVLLALPFYVAVLLALSGFFGAGLDNRWAAMAKLRELHFEPFYYHYYSSNTAALYSLLVHVAVYAPIGIAAWIFARERGSIALWISGLTAALAASATEALKLFLHGKYPDPSDVLIAVAAAIAACAAAMRLSRAPLATAVGSTATTPSMAADLRAPRRWPLRTLSLIILACVLASVGGVIAYQHEEHFVDESKLPQLPAPTRLPPVRIADFKYAHPRLPNPSAMELMTLVRNPAALDPIRARAGRGNGGFYEAVLEALIDPKSVDLALLHRRLMELKTTGRGDEQVKPLAVAYDWLYERWTGPQRSALAGKLVEGCGYIVDVIRRDRMSPYNVILYNAPLQALMACTLAIYGDDPRGDLLMRFTHDLWKNRVLPVWRQIMGRNGGWHEGGEYVAAGIGQAVYELPAMWRSATGEDLFKTEAGLRGFLDFLIYRRQPDGTDFRWGDGTAFDKMVPDAAALAVELRNAAAYSLRAPPESSMALAWPWGPLADPALRDPVAFSKLPVVRLFDGIGMIVARSDWTPEATYITFKAGDNYWSHSHLDQGAFTIYKGGQLAIDSGVYGPTYGSDHHMNYTYQTIAHNVVTVTDPEDTVPAPGKDQPRPIANDGGQRRIGSGWGVEAAPLDQAEWEAKRESYHTGTLGPVFDQGGFVVAAADLTSAYTNSQSGNGLFSARTRRVERFWRVFGYDHVEDVVVIYDRVIATKASFRKRWLLHTIDPPTIGPQAFRVFVAPDSRPGHAGGELQGKVLLPKEAVVNAIGGRGFEFFVGDRNYDEQGAIADFVKKRGPERGEAGAWRIEVSPPQDETEDAFLVVLLPAAAGATASHEVRLLEDGTRVGCEIVGPSRTTRWWFESSRNGVDIEANAGAELHRYRIEGPMEPVPEQQGWLRRLSDWIRAKATT
jgi:VanZ family protein